MYFNQSTRGNCFLNQLNPKNHQRSIFPIENFQTNKNYNNYRNGKIHEKTRPNYNLETQSRVEFPPKLTKNKLYERRLSPIPGKNIYKDYPEEHKAENFKNKAITQNPKPSPKIPYRNFRIENQINLKLEEEKYSKKLKAKEIIFDYFRFGSLSKMNHSFNNIRFNQG